MNGIIELTLASGCRIAIDADDISSVCEIKPVKGIKTSGKTSVRMDYDEVPWIVEENYDFVLGVWKSEKPA